MRTVRSMRLRARGSADPSDPSRLAPGSPREARRTPGAYRDMVIGAVAQHGLRVAPVAQRLQGQAVRVLEPVDRPVDASEQRRLVRDGPWPRASSLRAHRATLRHAPVGIHWISHTVMVTQQHCMSRLSRVFDSPASSAASACVPSIARVPEGPRQPYAVDAFASTRVGFLRSRIPAPARDARRRAMGERHGRRPSAPHAVTPGNGGPASTPSRRAARIPEFQVSSSPGCRPHRVVNSPDRLLDARRRRTVQD